MSIDKEKHITVLRSAMEGYAPVSETSWLLIRSLIRFQALKKGDILLRHGQVAKNLHFICKGAIRAYFTDAMGNIYDKNIFLDKVFSGSKVSLIEQTPSRFTLEALEDTLVINLNHEKYREYIYKNDDLKNFYIAYLEKNWVIEKEQREISLVMETATDRYLQLLQTCPDIDRRIPQRHIASHLGITPTQLSRIRKDLKKNHPDQHM